ncbi:MFS transporter [Aeromicrobium sp. Leaf350]|uniref:MFS transporter n=1 Tax=Aeromicrobium sp. Leaf350 TaxID=2876565 RepID=UPI001E4FAD2A|nr:MFS transporter [Aeromicrobium sp. Leaf350]
MGVPHDDADGRWDEPAPPVDQPEHDPWADPDAPAREPQGPHAAVKAVKGTGRAVAGGSRWAFIRARRFTHSGGAGESGLSRLLELHAFNTAGDAAVAISLAGTVFFTAPTDEATGQVALFLVLTMLPFAVVAPLIGPFLDKFQRGRRWAIGATLAVRAFSCWVLAGAVAEQSATFFIAALLCLVSSKAYGITRASAVPRLLPEQLTLVKANSRISLTGTAAGAISAPLAVGAAYFGAEWSLRYAFVLFVVGTVLAVLLPARVDSSDGEDKIDLTAANGVKGVLAPRGVVNALRCNAGLRLITGFLTIFMAFVLREPPESLGWNGNATILLGLVIGAAGAGSTVGVLLGNVLKSRAPEAIVVFVLIVDTAVLVVVSLTLSWVTAVVLGLTAGLCQSLGKLSLDALIQRDVPERVRTSMFARSETLIQLSWVTGGLIGIGLFTIEASVNVGLLVVAGIGLAWLAFVVVKLRNGPRQAVEVDRGETDPSI